MGETPKELNWVEVRAHWNVFKVFKDLEREVEEDIRQRNSFIKAPNEKSLGFKLETDGATIFSVHRSGNGLVSLLQFRLDKDVISVRDDTNKTVLAATLTLNDAGECSLRVGSAGVEQITHWQFRRRALESFFVF